MTAAARRPLLLALVLCALSLALAGGASAAYSDNVLTDGPIAYWRLGELNGAVALDSAPYHYDAQLVGTAPAGGALYSDPGNGGMSLDGASKIVSAQDWSWLGGAPLGGQANRAFSLEFWMKPAVIDGRYLWVISEQDKQPVRQGWAVMLTQQPGAPVTLSYERWADNAYVGGVVYRNDNAKLKNAVGVGKWTHVVVTYDGAPSFGGSNTLRLWVNGILVNASVAQSANMVGITQPFRVGQGDDPSSQPGFVGSVDELAIYGRAIWTVPQHYKSAFIAPQNTVAPSLSGTAARGQTLTVAPGTWTGGPAPDLTEQWQRCDSGGANCADISGAQGTTYTVADADAGSRLRAQVTGTNGGDAVTVATPVTTVVRGVAPASTAAPTISGSGTVGDALTASSGSWSGIPAPTFAYQWQRCNASGALCSDLPGATSSTYTPTVADAGTKLVVRVVASNLEGSATAASSPFAVTAGGGGTTAAAPANTAVPTISGNPLEGATLTATQGSWSNAPTGFAYQWQRCGSTCVDVAGATGATYAVTSADVGSSLAVVVTASNAGGSASATSATVGPVGSAVQAPAPPVVTTPPSISGQPVEGATAIASPGAWSGSPTSFAYQWRRCASTCVDVATGQSYALASADVASTLTVTVTATGPGGSASASSAAFGPVAAAAPVSTAAPVVSGTAVEGGTLSATAGSWTGASLAFAYQWRRCGATCADVAGATGSSYALGSADVGSTLVVVVTATNAGGSASATSAPTAQVLAAAPVSTAAPTVSGTPADGATLTASTGTWSGSGLVYAYQWKRCDATCADVAGATAATYAVGPTDVASALAVVVTATNAGGSASATSAQTAKVAAAAPVANAAPSVSGTPVDGGTLAATAGDWSGTAPIATTFQWQRCDATCAPVAGATGATYTAGAADVGSALAVVVTATNAAGTATSTSARTAKVAAAAPVSTAAPAISGTALAGATLTATPGTWSGTAPIGYAYQWQRCASGACADIAGAIAATYVLGAADVGASVAVRVTATNAGGSASAASAQTDAVKAVAPVSKVAPVVSGTVVDGQTLTATTGTWDGTDPLAYDYAWQRCDASGAACAAIPGAAAASYAIVPTDAGSTLRVVVTATNGAGSASAPSAVVGPVAGVAPASTDAPLVSGTVAIGSTLTASAGTWSGTAPLTYAYQWQRCAAACAPIAGETTQSYVVQAADYGAALRVDVTAKNGAGTATESSTQTAVVADTIAPTLAISSVASGVVSLTVTVTAADGESGLAAAPTCTLDGRAAALKPAGDGAWTLSVLALGSHAVACSVADRAGNRATASATVKPGGAREIEQSLLTQVNRLLATATPRDAARLTKVGAALGDALTPANWVDSNHLVASRGRNVFDANQEAAGSLVDLLKDRQSQVPDATTISMLLTIAQVDRVLAATAIADAVSTKGSKAKADEAKDELDKSDTAAVRGDTMSALAHFENAWRRAQK